MSVKELSSKSQTSAYFSDLAHQFGDKQTLYAFGQGAFLTDNGSVVVRKDWKVLLVDSTRLGPSRLPRSSQAHRPRPWRRSSWRAGPETSAVCHLLVDWPQPSSSRRPIQSPGSAAAAGMAAMALAVWTVNGVRASSSASLRNIRTNATSG